MVDDKKPEQEVKKQEAAEVPINSPEAVELKEAGEVKEASPEKDLAQLKQELEATEVDDHLHQSAQASAQTAQALQDEEKIQHLLSLAKDKGVIFAVKVAQKMNDPYVLDRLHDMLAKNGYYKDLLK